MKQYPLISVIVPVYGVEKYLDRCVQSIVDQTYKNLEIILVDDGSPDNCGAMCDVWAAKDSRIKVIHKENGGLSDARNAGMAVATGELMAFVDSDDWIAEEYLSAMYLALADTKSDIAACDICFVSEKTVPEIESEKQSGWRVCTPEQAIADITKGTGFRAVAWNKLYKRELLTDERYPVGKHHEDEFFTYRILGKAARLVYVDTKLYYYLQRQGSIMHAYSIKRLDALDAYLERLYYLRERFPSLYLQDKISFCYSCAAFYLLARGSQDESAIKKKIRTYRKKIKFSWQELRHCSVSQVVYVMGTGCCISLFCRALGLRRRGEENE